MSGVHKWKCLCSTSELVKKVSQLLHHIPEAMDKTLAYAPAGFTRRKSITSNLVSGELPERFGAGETERWTIPLT